MLPLKYFLPEKQWVLRVKQTLIQCTVVDFSCSEEYVEYVIFMLGEVSRPATCCSYLAPCWASWWATCLLRSGCSWPPPAAGYTPLSGSQISGDVSGIHLVVPFYSILDPDPVWSETYWACRVRIQNSLSTSGLSTYLKRSISSLITRTLLKKSFKILSVLRVRSRIKLQIQNDKESKPIQIQKTVVKTTDKNIIFC